MKAERNRLTKAQSKVKAHQIAKIGQTKGTATRAGMADGDEPTMTIKGDQQPDDNDHHHQRRPDDGGQHPTIDAAPVDVTDSACIGY